MACWLMFLKGLVMGLDWMGYGTAIADSSRDIHSFPRDFVCFGNDIYYFFTRVGIRRVSFSALTPRMEQSRLMAGDEKRLNFDCTWDATLYGLYSACSCTGMHLHENSKGELRLLQP